MTARPLVSIVSPVYGCRDCLIELASRVRAGFEGTDLGWELVLVDDRGPDDPWPVIADLARDDGRIRGVRLARNHGQHLAIWAGLEAARGDWVAVIDCDLQDDPGVIPALHAHALESEVDAVIVERGKWHDTRLRRMASRAYSRTLNWLTGFRIDNNIGNFGLYSRRMVDVLLKFRDKEVFLPVMVALTGLPRVLYRIDRSERHAGESSYNLLRLLRMAVAIIIRFSDRPLKLSVIAGLAFSGFAAVFSILLMLAWVTGAFTVPGWTSIILSVWFLSGLILAVLGIHGFYVGRIFREVQDRPRILVELYNRRDGPMKGLSHPEAIRAGRYITVGLVTNISLYLFFLLLVSVGLPPVGASASCYLLGVAFSYLLNRKWSFSSKAGHRHDLPRFLAAYGAGLGVTVVVMSLLVAPLAPALAQILTVFLASAVIFVTLRLLGFGRA